MNHKEEQAFKALISAIQLEVKCSGTYDEDKAVQKFRSICSELRVKRENVELMQNCYYRMRNEFINPLIASAYGSAGAKHKAVTTFPAGSLTITECLEMQDKIAKADRLVDECFELRGKLDEAENISQGRYIEICELKDKVANLTNSMYSYHETNKQLAKERDELHAEVLATEKKLDAKIDQAEELTNASSLISNVCDNIASGVDIETDVEYLANKLCPMEYVDSFLEALSKYKK